MLRISWNTTTTALEGGALVAASYEHTLEFDCVTSETHEGTSVLTEHAVEDGAPLTSHKRANPERITIEAVVTNTPLDTPPASGYGAGAPVTTRIAGPTDNATGGAAVLLFSADFDRIGDVESTLRRLRLEATEVTLSTAIRTYERVQIVSVTIPREPGDGDSIRVILELQQVRIAFSRTVDSPEPREPRGSSTRDRGGQEASDSSAQARTSSIQAAREEYARRREAGESVYDSAIGATGAAFGG